MCSFFNFNVWFADLKLLTLCFDYIFICYFISSIFLKLATCPFKDPAIELRSVTSRYHGSKIPGAQATTTATATRTSKKRNRSIVAKQQLCRCITLICTFLRSRCRTELRNLLISRALYGVGEHNALTRKFRFLFENGLLTQMIHNGGGFFGWYPKPDTLDTWSETFLYYGSEKSEYSQR